RRRSAGAAVRNPADAAVLWGWAWRRPLLRALRLPARTAVSRMGAGPAPVSEPRPVLETPLPARASGVLDPTAAADRSRLDCQSPFTGDRVAVSRVPQHGVRLRARHLAVVEWGVVEPAGRVEFLSDPAAARPRLPALAGDRPARSVSRPR